MLSVTNRSDKPQVLDLEKGKWQDLYQQSINRHPSYYFGIFALKNENEFKISKASWIVLIVILELILFLESGLVRKITIGWDKFS